MSRCPVNRYIDNDGEDDGDKWYVGVCVATERGADEVGMRL